VRGARSSAKSPSKEMTGSTGGYYVLEPSVLDLIADDAVIWEQGPLPALARRGELRAFRHEGFWRGIDTQRDLFDVRELWDSGERPWSIR